MNKRGAIEITDLILLFGVFASLFLHHRINGFILMLFIIFAFLKIILKKMPLHWLKDLVFFPILFVILVIGVSYSSDTERAWTLVERTLAFLLVPFAAQSIFQFSTKSLEQLKWGFIFSALAASVYCLLAASISAIDLGGVSVSAQDDHFLYNVFMHHRLSSPLGLHAVYFSLFIAFVNLMVLQKVLSLFQQRDKKSILWGSIFIFFAVMLYLLKSANISFGFVSCSVLILFYFYGKKLWASTLSKVASLGVIVLLIIFGFLAVWSKLETFSFEYEMSNELMSPIGIRLSIWECAFEVIKENLWFGSGTGDSQEILNSIYEKNNFTIGLKGEFNAHNQYLEYWMSNGIIMLMTFIGGFVVLSKKAISNKNVIFLSFVILFALFSFTESTLRTQKGLVFFVLLSVLFYWRPKMWCFYPDEKE